MQFLLAWLLAAGVLSAEVGAACADEAKIAAEVDPAGAREAEAVAALRKVGGKIRRDEERPGTPVVEETLLGYAVKDATLNDLAALRQLRGLHLDVPHV